MIKKLFVSGFILWMGMTSLAGATSPEKLEKKKETLKALKKMQVTCKKTHRHKTINDYFFCKHGAAYYKEGFASKEIPVKRLISNFESSISKLQIPILKELCEDAGAKYDTSNGADYPLCYTKFKNSGFGSHLKDIDELKVHVQKYKKEKEKEKAIADKKSNHIKSVIENIIAEYEKKPYRDISKKEELCNYVADHYNKYSTNGSFGHISYQNNNVKVQCFFDWQNSKRDEALGVHKGLETYAAKNTDIIKKIFKEYVNALAKRQQDVINAQFSQFDKIKSKGRIYATLVMDTTEKYNKDAINILRKNDNKIAGLSVKFKKDNSSNLINKITLKSPTEHPVTIILAGRNKSINWSLEKINMIVNTIKSKYEKIDSKRNTQEYNLKQVREGILRYHNARKRPSQSAYELDLKHAESIKNLKETFVFKNQSDRINVTVTTCIKGQRNSNTELHAYEIYQNSLTIEYVSKTLLEKNNKTRSVKLNKERKQKQKQKEANEVNSL